MLYLHISSLDSGLKCFIHSQKPQQKLVRICLKKVHIACSYSVLCASDQLSEDWVPNRPRVFSSRSLIRME